MKLFLLLFISTISFCQTNYYSFESRKAFADYLFCEKDYLRAAMEYNAINMNNDSLKFKEAYSYIKIYDFEKAEAILSALDNQIAKSELKIIYFIKHDFAKYDKIKLDDSGSIKLDKIRLLLSKANSDEQEYLNIFGNNKFVKNVLAKKNRTYKSKTIAGLLSAVVPGAGKIYTESYTDGLFSLLSTSILAYLSYDNFRAGHNFRGYLFAGIGSLLYAGNIYGSIADANIFNMKIDSDFTLTLNHFLDGNNYFRNDYEFCK